MVWMRVRLKNLDASYLAIDERYTDLIGLISHGFCWARSFNAVRFSLYYGFPFFYFVYPLSLERKREIERARAIPSSTAALAQIRKVNGRKRRRGTRKGSSALIARVSSEINPHNALRNYKFRLFSGTITVPKLFMQQYLNSLVCFSGKLFGIWLVLEEKVFLQSRRSYFWL